jgi:hypothetical protein
MLALLLHWVSRSSHLPFAHELIDKIHDRAQYASNSGLVVFDGESRKRVRFNTRHSHQYKSENQKVPDKLVCHGEQKSEDPLTP